MTRSEGIFYGLIVGVLVLTVGSGVLGAVAVVMKAGLVILDLCTRGEN